MYQFNKKIALVGSLAIFIGCFLSTLLKCADQNNTIIVALNNDISGSLGYGGTPVLNPSQSEVKNYSLTVIKSGNNFTVDGKFLQGDKPITIAKISELSKDHKIVFHAAFYGDFNQNQEASASAPKTSRPFVSIPAVGNVTKINDNPAETLASLLSKGTLSGPSLKNKWFGDPAVGIIKNFVVCYSTNNQLHLDITSENDLTQIEVDGQGNPKSKATQTIYGAAPICYGDKIQLRHVLTGYYVSAIIDGNGTIGVCDDDENQALWITVLAPNASAHASLQGKPVPQDAIIRLEAELENATRAYFHYVDKAQPNSSQKIVELSPVAATYFRVANNGPLRLGCKFKFISTGTSNPELENSPLHSDSNIYIDDIHNLTSFGPGARDDNDWFIVHNHQTVDHSSKNTKAANKVSKNASKPSLKQNIKDQDDDNDELESRIDALENQVAIISKKLGLAFKIKQHQTQAKPATTNAHSTQASKKDDPTDAKEQAANTLKTEVVTQNNTQMEQQAITAALKPQIQSAPAAATHATKKVVLRRKKLAHAGQRVRTLRDQANSKTSTRVFNIIK